MIMPITSHEAANAYDFAPRDLASAAHVPSQASASWLGTATGCLAWAVVRQDGLVIWLAAGACPCGDMEGASGHGCLRSARQRLRQGLRGRRSRARHAFDSFECAIQRMAPMCEHCGCKVIGHGVEVEERFFCCAHCAREATSTERIQDRADKVGR